MKDLKQGIVYMSFTTYTKYRSTAVGGKRTITSNTEYIVGNTRMHYKADDMQVYSDEIDNFTIIPSRKTIYWSNSLLDRSRDADAKSYKMIQDDLFASCKLVSCVLETNKEKNYTKIITLEPLANKKHKFPYHKIVFYINTTTKEIKKVVTDYLEKIDYEQITIVYNKLQYNYPLSTATVPVKKMIMLSDGSLLANYKTYKLIDNRLKSGNK